MTTAEVVSAVKLAVVEFDGFCLVESWVHSGADVRGGDYTEVYCPQHDWSCAHRHRQWGPWVRCATRHQEDPT